jgi:hypothetical protein
MPSPNKTSGRIQHEEAASAPSNPPTAIHAGPRVEALAALSPLIVMT